MLRLYHGFVHSFGNSLVKYVLRQEPRHPIEHGMRHPRSIQSPPAPNPGHDRPREAVRGGAHEGRAGLVAVGLNLTDGDAREADAGGRVPELLVVVEGARERTDECLRGGVRDEARRRDICGDGADELRDDGAVPRGGAQLGEEGACEEEGEHCVLVHDPGEARVCEAVDTMVGVEAVSRDASLVSNR